MRVKNFEFKIPSIEFEIIYKELVLKGKKDIEDASHLRTFFSGMLKEEKFKEYRSQLFQRIEHTILTLAHVGIKASQLQTDGLVELFYNLYNPEELEKHAVFY